MQPIKTSVEDTWLTLPKYQFWLDAIKTDDARSVRLILESSDYLTRSKLLNGTFKITPIRKEIQSTTKRHSIVRPFSLAAMHGSMEVCDVMIRNDVDVFIQEAKDYNVIHCLVCVAFYQPKYEKTVVDQYERLCEMLSKESIARLLHMEDELGLRPLEFAAHLGTLQFMMALWETPRVYMVRQDVVGVFLYKWYDITEYMTHGSDTARHIMKSPLQFMVHLDRKPFYSESGRRVLNESIIADWIGRSVKSKGHTFRKWLVLKLVYILTFSIYQVYLSKTLIPYTREDNGMSTNFNESAVECESYSKDWFSGGLKIFLETYLIMHSIMIILYYVATFIVSVENRKLYLALSRDNQGRKKDGIFNPCSLVQQYVNAIFAILVVIEIFILDYPTTQNVSFLTMIHVIQTPVILDCVMQCISVSDSVGHIVVYIQRMTDTYWLFLGMSAIFTVAFARMFVLLSQRGETGCVEEFSGIFISVYTTTLIFFNILDLRQLQIEYPTGMYCSHVVFIFVAVIMLFNLQIAMFSDDVKEVYENKSMVISINQIWAVGEIDFVFSNIPVSSRLYNYSNERQIRDNFVCVADRIYLLARVSAKKQQRQVKGLKIRKYDKHSNKDL